MLFPRTDYEKKGWCKIPKFFKSDTLRAIENGLQPLRANNSVKLILERDGITIRSIMGFHSHNSLFKKVCYDESLLHIVRKVIPGNVYISQSKINIKRGLLGKRWNYHRGFSFWHLLDGIPKPDLVSVFVCLTKQTEENGAVFVLNGSHIGCNYEVIHRESEVKRTGPDGDTSENLSININSESLKQYTETFEQEYMVADPGDLILMHPNLIHASEDNRTEDERGLMILVFNSDMNLPTKFDRPTYLSEPVNFVR